jgi:hypothetical protein
MKKFIWVCALLIVPLSLLHARGRDFGAGIAIGNPTGISGKYWLNSRNAVDGELAFPGSNDVYLHVDYLWHDYNAFPKPEQGRLPLYYGVGGFASVDRVGPRGVIGIEYIFAKNPFDLFLELAPELNIAPSLGMTLTGGIGGRYFFGG